jgi:hypothetical protein
MVAIVRLADHIDRYLATSSDPPNKDTHWFGDRATLDYLGITEDDVLRGWKELAQARSDALRTFA